MPKRIPRHNYPLLGLVSSVLFLLIFGALILSSVSADISQKYFGNTYQYLKHQIIIGMLGGVVLGYLVYKISLKWLKKIALLLLLFALLLLVLVFLPKIGMEAKGASRWIAIGSFKFQPIEFLKLAFIVYLASWLSSRTEKEKISQYNKKSSWQTLAAFLIILALIAFILALQPNVSAIILISLIGITMYFIAGMPLKHIVLIIFLGVVAFCAGCLIFQGSYQMDRLTIFLHPNEDPLGIGYQLRQSLIAVGSGGLFGRGLGLSGQIAFLPEAMTDSIFAIICEQMGFLGAFFLLFLYMVFLWSGFMIARQAKNNFSHLVACGITVWIIAQSFVNIGAMIGILPLTGVPLPFISYGGSAIIAELIGVGLLLNIAKNG